MKPGNVVAKRRALRPGRYSPRRKVWEAFEIVVNCDCKPCAIDNAEPSICEMVRIGDHCRLLARAASDYRSKVRSPLGRYSRALSVEQRSGPFGPQCQKSVQCGLSKRGEPSSGGAAVAATSASPRFPVFAACRLLSSCDVGLRCARVDQPARHEAGAGQAAANRHDSMPQPAGKRSRHFSNASSRSQRW